MTFGALSGLDFTDSTTALGATYMGAADALIFVVDPFLLLGARRVLKIPDAVGNVPCDTAEAGLKRLTTALRTSHAITPRSYISVPIAVAIVKFDVFEGSLGIRHRLFRPSLEFGGYREAEGQFVHEYIRALLHRQWVGGPIDNHLQKNYRHYRFFGVSFLGLEPTSDSPRTAGIWPFQVLQPVRWVLKQRGVLPTMDS